MDAGNLAEDGTGHWARGGGGSRRDGLQWKNQKKIIREVGASSIFVLNNMPKFLQTFSYFFF
jgi:hypothetical protein